MVRIHLNQVLVYALSIGSIHHATSQEIIPIPSQKIEIEVTRKANEWSMNWATKELESGVTQLDLQFESSNPVVPTEVLLKWKTSSHGIAGIWHPVLGASKSIKPDWARDLVQSRAAVNAPVINYFAHDDGNLLTIASAEAVNTVSIHGSIREEDAYLHSRIRFFTEAMPAMTKYNTSILFDSRNISFDQALQGVTKWWESFDHLQPASVPDLARYPMYSTWYSYHQTLVTDDLIKECKTSYDLGYRTIIVDDGWQTLDANRGYAFTGDWQPERIPDMKGFVEEVHQLGMKFMLWYSVPFVGINSEAYERFKGKYLFERLGLDAYVLDPRYPEVRQYLINIYKDALLEWNLDGFKLDFIDDFHAVDTTELTLADGRDFASVNEAVDRMMTDIIKELKSIRPDVLIEFRQRYIGPAMRKYGNMFRAADCPNDAVTNRLRITDLRLISGNTAVHSDMLMWDRNEPVETAALQLLNILFSVPQVSVKLDDLSEDHLKMIRFYTGYWNANREVLLDGKFEAMQPLAKYPLIASTLNNHKIIGLYTDQWIDLETLPGRIDVVNGKSSDKILLNLNRGEGVYKVIIYNCLGEEVTNQEINLKAGMNEFIVPPSGMISLERNS